VQRNNVRGNGGVGLYLFPESGGSAAAYRENVVVDNFFGTVTNGIDMGSNSRNDTTTCPWPRAGVRPASIARVALDRRRRAGKGMRPMTIRTQAPRSLAARVTALARVLRRGDALSLGIALQLGALALPLAALAETPALRAPGPPAAAASPGGLGESAWHALPPRDLFAGATRPEPPAPVGAASPAAPAARSDSLPDTVWWYTIDALRADVLDATLADGPLLPNLARFAREDAVRFGVAYSLSSFTKTSTASMFTGLWPQRHGVMNGSLPVWPAGRQLVFDLDRRLLLLAEWMQQRGFTTVTHPYTVHAREGDGLLDGFERLDLAVDRPEALPDTLTRPGRRVFVYEHVLGVHAPYAPSAAARARLAAASQPVAGAAASAVDPASTAWYRGPVDAAGIATLRRAYLAEAHDADAAFAARIAWLKRIGRYDEALILVTADHGEAFGEHGQLQHTTSLYEEVVRVPLLVKFPRSSRYAALRGNVIPNRVSLAAIYPTLVELSGRPGPPYALDEESLLPVLDGRETDPRQRRVMLRSSVLRAESGPTTLFVQDAIVSGSSKAVFGYRLTDSQVAPAAQRQGDWIAELYDLERDPGERTNLAPASQQRFLALMAEHQAGEAPLGQGPDVQAKRAPEGSTKDDASLVEKLKALGYLQ